MDKLNIQCKDGSSQMIRVQSRVVGNQGSDLCSESDFPLLIMSHFCFFNLSHSPSSKGICPFLIALASLIFLHFSDHLVTNILLIKTSMYDLISYRTNKLQSLFTVICTNQQYELGKTTFSTWCWCLYIARCTWAMLICYWVTQNVRVCLWEFWSEAYLGIQI